METFHSSTKSSPTATIGDAIRANLAKRQNSVTRARIRTSSLRPPSRRKIICLATQ